MITEKQMVEFLDSNGYYGLDEMVELFTDIVNNVYQAETFITDVKEFNEHNE